MPFMQSFAEESSLRDIFNAPAAAVEEGLQLAKSQIATPKDVKEVDDSYGSLHKLARTDTVVGAVGSKVANKAYSYMQQLAVAIAALWLLCTLASHLGSWLSPSSFRARGSSPAPAPGLTTTRSQASCPLYTYPQCEDAMRFYLSGSARSRCEAFERVKAEGDFFKFPYSATSRETCATPGCCGCSGQCSKCPPILPECSTWQLDGIWKVAFSDGTEAKYSFDAHGHVEMELPTSALPTTWKVYQHAYIPDGNDVQSPGWLSLAEGESMCNAMAECRGFTYDETTRSTLSGFPTYYIFLKRSVAFVPGPGTGWVTHVAEQKPELHGQAALAGPVKELSRSSAGNFSFDLYLAAPQLFPEGSMETFEVDRNGELKVHHHIRGKVAQSGVGISVKQ